MYAERKKLYAKLEKARSSKVILYMTSDRENASGDIRQDAINPLVEHLDTIGVTEKISLILHTNGGETLAAWNIANLLRMYCDTLEIIVPHKALSAGTLLSLSANTIIMTKQATLGPIDPSVNDPLNPIININGVAQNLPMSVEAIKGYLEFVKEDLNLKDDVAMLNVLQKLSDKIHPYVLGKIHRTSSQIRMLAEKLIVNQLQDKEKISNLIAFLCGDAGSHDYTINRREASGRWGLNIEKPDAEQYKIIKNIYSDLQNELNTGATFYSDVELQKGNGKCQISRAVIESIKGGSHNNTADYWYIFNQQGQIVGNQLGEPVVHIANKGWIKI